MADAEDEIETPLDPALDRVRRKMLRMMLVTLGVTFLGLMAVVGALVYRVAGREPPAPVAASQAVPVPVGDGRSLSGMALDGSGARALLRLSGPQGEELLLLDLGSGTVVGRYRLTP